MRNRRAKLWVLQIIGCCLSFHICFAQCPQFPTSSITGNNGTLCEGSSITLSVTGLNLTPGSTVDWYIAPSGTFNPYNGEGTLIGSVPVELDPCNNPPEVLYIMVNPDNVQAGGSGDQCDEFMVIWTGSGGFATSDILVSNLGPGSFQWDSFIAGNATNFSCGVPLPPGPVPPNAILIIQSSPNNNVFIDSDNLCASGLPVYIISYDGTASCTGGYFDNNSPCSSCPVMIGINGATCQFDIDLDYMPPGSSIDGWGWSNNGSGVFADVVPPVDIPAFMPPAVIVDDFVWTVPADFCDTQGGGDYWITGIIDPPPTGACLDIFTSFFGLEVSCPELMLTGGGDVCEGNCPEAPTEMIFSIVGDDVPFEVDIVVTATLFGSFPISGLQISNGQTIFVCLEGFFPSFDPVTGILNIPTLAIGFMATVTIVSATSASGCPVELNQNSVTLHFIAAPSANAGNDQTICSYETVTLSGDIGGSAIESLWTTDGDGTFDDPSNLDATYTPGPSDIANGQAVLTLFGTDENGSCIPAESTLTIIIEPSLLIEVNTPLTICDNDVATIFAMVTGSTEPCSWETSGDGTFDDPSAENTIYNPGNGDIQNGSVTLFYNPINSGICLEGNEPLELTIVAAPQVVIPQDLEICEGDSAVITIDIDGAFSNVTWSAPGDGILVVDSDMEVTYTPGPMDINNQFFIVSVLIQSSFPECGQITYNISVDIVDCDCPPLESDPPASSLCALNDMLDLSSLLAMGGSGTWSISNAPPGVNPATISGIIFSTFNADPGIYTVLYTLNFPEPGCPSTTSEEILVAGLIMPFAGPDMAFCGPQSVMVSGNITPANAVPVLWETLGDGSFLDNSSLNTTYVPGTLDSVSTGFYLVLHALDTICSSQSDTVSLFFNQEPFALFTTDTALICNTQANGSVINFYSLIIDGDTTGTWTNTSGVPVDFSNPSSVNFDGIAEGYYPFQYQTASAVSPCGEVTYSIFISVEECLCPLIMAQNVPGGICNSQADLPLNAFIMAGAPGSWQIISTPPGSNPGTLSGSTFIINGCDPGDYDLRFTLDAAPIDACPDSAEIVIFIQDQPTLIISGDTSNCGETDVQLLATIGGSTVGVMWNTSGTGIFSNASTLNPNYTPSLLDVSSALVSLIASATDTLGFCPLPSDTILLVLYTAPSTTFSALSDVLCNNPDSGSVINLSSFIIQGDITGVWTDIDGAMVDLSDPTQVDFDGIAPGNYRFNYTTQTAIAPCTDSTYTFLVTVEDCTCPPLSVSSTGINMCQSSVIDLNDQIINVAPGNWMITSGPMIGPWPQIIGTELSTYDAAAGNYVVTYTLTDSVPGCQASTSIPLFVEVIPFITIVDIGCDSAHTSFEVLVETDASTLISDFGDVSIAGTGQFKIASIPVGQDIVVFVTSTSGLCSMAMNISAPNCNCTLFIENIADTLTFCPGDTFVLIPFITGAQGFALSTWVTPSGTKMLPALPVYQEGKYIWIVKDTANCEERDTFNAVFIGPEGADVTSLPPSCPGSLDGQIVILSVDDGLAPYMVQLDAGPLLLINQFPFIIDQVGIGNHVLTITDIIGCAIDLAISVDNQSFGSLDLGPDVLVLKGDSVFINPTAEGINISTVSWNPSVIILGIEPFWFTPDSTTLLSIIVTDTAGCQYVDQMLITVYDKETFYIPNIFSPNGDQINDELIIYSNLPDDRFISLEIFDRWGNMMYGQYAAFPFHWDGRSRGKDVMTGVYVYKVIWKDDAGNALAMIGDLTLIR